MYSETIDSPRVSFIVFYYCPRRFSSAQSQLYWPLFFTRVLLLHGFLVRTKPTYITLPRKACKGRLSMCPLLSWAGRTLCSGSTWGIVCESIHPAAKMLWWSTNAADRGPWCLEHLAFISKSNKLSPFPMGGQVLLNNESLSAARSLGQKRVKRMGEWGSGIEDNKL